MKKSTHGADQRTCFPSGYPTDHGRTTEAVWLETPLLSGAAPMRFIPTIHTPQCYNGRSSFISLILRHRSIKTVDILPEKSPIPRS